MYRVRTRIGERSKARRIKSSHELKNIRDPLDENNAMEIWYEKKYQIEIAIQRTQSSQRKNEEKNKFKRKMMKTIVDFRCS